VPPNDASALAAAIDELLGDDTALRTLSDAGQDWAIQ
jgi:hypothetical protein